MSDRRAELEAAIDAEPHDRAAHEVYADELQRLDDPRGELIALQLADDAGDVQVRARALIAANHLEPGPRLRNVEWRWGFVRSAELDTESATTDELAAILDHPSLRFLSSLELPAVETGHQPAIDALARHPRPSLRWLEINKVDDSTISQRACDVGHLDALWRHLPNLYSLVISGQNVTLGELALPQLTSLSIASVSLRPDVLAAVVDGSCSSLSLLHLGFGYSTPAPEDLERLLAHPFPALTTFHVSGGFLDEAIEPIARSALLRRLRCLAFSYGLTDRGAAVIARHADAFGHLGKLDLSINYLSPTGIALVRTVACEVNTDLQGEPLDRDPDLYDY